MELLLMLCLTTYASDSSPTLEANPSLRVDIWNVFAQCDAESCRREQTWGKAKDDLEGLHPKGLENMFSNQVGELLIDFDRECKRN